MYINDIVNDIGVAPCTVYRWIRQKKLEAKRVSENKHLRFKITTYDYLRFLIETHRYIQYSTIYSTWIRGDLDII